MRANAAAASGTGSLHHEQFSYFSDCEPVESGCGPSWASKDSDNDVYRSREKTSKGPIVRFHVVAI